MTGIARWFTSPTSLFATSILRLLLVGTILGELEGLLFQFAIGNDVPAPFRHNGPWLLFSPIPLQLTTDGVSLFSGAIWIAGILAFVGLATRFSTIVFALLYAHLSASLSAVGWHDHGPSLTAQVLVLLAIAPGLAVLSLDAWCARRLGWFGDKTGERVVSGWAMRGILLLTVLFYATSGLSKLRYGGIERLSGETLSFYLSGASRSTRMQLFGSAEQVLGCAEVIDQSCQERESFRDGIGITHYLYGGLRTPLGGFISESPILSSLGAIGAVALELSMLCTLFGGVWGVLYLFAAIFHVSVYFLMGISFFPWIAIDLGLFVFLILDKRMRALYTPGGSL